MDIKTDTLPRNSNVYNRFNVLQFALRMAVVIRPPDIVYPVRSSVAREPGRKKSTFVETTHWHKRCISSDCGVLHAFGTDHCNSFDWNGQPSAASTSDQRTDLEIVFPLSMVSIQAVCSGGGHDGTAEVDI